MGSLNQIDQPLNRIIVEATNRCNLDCSMCIRGTWKYSPGNMSSRSFSALLDDLREFSPVPEIFFGGYGEPLSHPEIIGMIHDVKGTGARVELVSNGTLLSPELSRDLILSGLDRLWISMDNIHQDSIRENPLAQISQLIPRNLEDFLDLKNDLLTGPDLGLVIVLNQTNSSTISDLINQGIKIGVRSFFFTNLEAFSEDMARETLYQPEQLRRPGSWLANHSDLAREMNSLDNEIIIKGVIGNVRTCCPFAEKGEIVMRWDGEVSPCLPLLYDHASFIGSWKHQVNSHSLGNIQSRSIQQIWDDAEYSSLRDRLLDEKFSPCLSCRDCWLSDDNQMDCMGFEHPTCGGCLWAHGIISCP